MISKFCLHAPNYTSGFGISMIIINHQILNLDLIIQLIL
jgi:hypothetical protein